MKVIELSNELIINMLLENTNNEMIKSIGQLNTNIRRASAGAIIKPQLSTEKLNRSLLKKILKLATPAELEILATQFLSQNGFKVTKGITPEQEEL